MNQKNRHWTFVVYPESVKDDWINILIETGVPFAISPLHDKDLNPTGEAKKSHYHVCLTFDGPTTYNNVKTNICDVIGSTIPQRVLSLRGIYRYLCHLDNPDKHQYNVNDIQEYNNFHIDLTESELVFEKAKIIDDININDLRDYFSLCKFYLEISDMQRFKIVSSNTYFFSKYIDSRNHTFYN